MPKLLIFQNVSNMEKDIEPILKNINTMHYVLIVPT